MKLKSKTIMKLFIILIIFIYVNYVDINNLFNTLDALVTLFFSITLFLKSRKNLMLSIIFLFILYCNYSIIMGEYIIIGDLSVPFTQVKNQQIYGLNIRILLLFMSVIALFYNSKKFDVIKYKLEPKDNLFVFSLMIITLLISLVIGVDRGNFNEYSVRISPIFEYSKLLFLFAYYFSGKSIVRKNIIITLIGIFILQDFYYGGRITSLQLMILFAMTIWVERLTFKKIVLFSFFGIVLNSLVANYRNSYSFSGVNLVGLFKSLFENYFVFDTATFSYYASATHVAASQIVSNNIRLNSFLEFSKSVFIGSGSTTSDVTTFVSKDFFSNMGGGLIPTHFYFWLGWLGVLFIAFFIVFLLNNLKFEENEYQKILFYAVLINAPRWYLYTPNQLFRGSLFFVTILWMILWLVKTITSNRGNRSSL